MPKSFLKRGIIAGALGLLACTAAPATGQDGVPPDPNTVCLNSLAGVYGRTNRVCTRVDEQADAFVEYLLHPSAHGTVDKAGVQSTRFWLFA